jgi:hypothetical protein
MVWSLYKEIRYGSTLPAENLTDFPLLISIASDTDIAAECSGGGGIKVTSADGSTNLSFGVYPSTNLATGKVILRTKVTLLTAAAVGDVIARLYYSSSETTSDSKAATVSNGYVLFLPFDEDPSTSAPQIRDWVSNTLIGTSQGSMTSGDLVDAVAGKGLDFDGSNDGISFPATISALNTRPTNNATVEISAYMRSPGSAGILLGCRTNQYDTSGILIYTWAGTLICAFGLNGDWTNIQTGAMSANTWYTVAATYVANSQKLFLNGAQNGPTYGASSAITYYGSQGWHFGTDLENANRLNGILDEARVSSVTRTPNWLSYSFTNERTPGNTFTLGVEKGATLVTDAFTGTDGTSILTHVATSGHTYDNNFGVAGGYIQGNRFRHNSAFGDAYVFTQRAKSYLSSNDHYAKIQIKAFGVGQYQRAGVVVRMNPTTFVGYGLFASLSAGTLAIYRLTTGGELSSNLAEVTGLTFAVDDVLHLTVVGDVLTGYVNNIQRVTATNNGIASSVGFGFLSAAGNTGNLELDNFEAGIGTGLPPNFRVTDFDIEVFGATPPNFRVTDFDIEVFGPVVPATAPSKALWHGQGMF